MSEYINKEELKQAVRDKWKDFETRVEVNCIVNEMPTIEIVTCKECKHRRGGNCFKEYPPGFSSKKDMDYCSKGERRTE